MAGVPVRKLAIANRGEVAVRIINACHELGIRTVLLHSEADMGSIAYRLSDEQICIGPAATSESYLHIDNNIHGALSAGADAIHPGFGFLSENAEFARICIDRGMSFVGPSPEAIRLLGDKVEAKKLAQAAHVPTVPGYQGDDQRVETLLREAEKIGFPVLVKAKAGGGGRGMKVLKSRNEAKDLIESAQREAQASFGSSEVFLEKYLDHPKHIEFQIFGNSAGRVCHLFERECTIQRRHQKIIEEALSPSLTPELREEMGETAVRIAEQARYQSAGTVEFLLQDGKFYFLEINTRLQVEHPVTEEILGIDLVKAQLLQAQGRDPVWNHLRPQGHSIECRLYAEDAFNRGLPSTGKLGYLNWPHAAGRRFEVGFETGDEVTPFYDPMIAKIIVHDESRPRALRKMLRTLNETVVFGVKTNIPFLKEILAHPDFISGAMTTRFIETYFPEGLSETKPSEMEKAFIEKAQQSTFSSESARPDEMTSPWSYRWEGR